MKDGLMPGVFEIFLHYFLFFIIAGMVKELYMPGLIKAGMEHFGSLEIFSGMINDKRRFVIMSSQNLKSAGEREAERGERGKRDT